MNRIVKVILITVIGASLLILSFVVFAFFLLRIWTSDERKETSNKSIKSDYLYGVSFSPKSSQPLDFLGFYSAAKKAGNTITWAGKWEDLVDKAAPYSIGKLAVENNLEMIVLVGTHSGNGEIKPNKPFDQATKQKYLGAAKDYVVKFTPKYFIIGVEVNRIANADPRGFNDFVTLFADTAAEIKKVSPKTKVATVFQLEQMKGLNGGLFGGVNDAARNQWSLVNQFPLADVVGFTTYPGLIFKDPSEIPNDYYLEISQKIKKPIIFTEIGWSSGQDNIAGWESSEDEQALFVSRFFELTKALKPKVTIWSFLFDQAVGAPFNNNGLIKSTGTEKKGLEAWISVQKN